MSTVHIHNHCHEKVLKNLLVLLWKMQEARSQAPASLGVSLGSSLPLQSGRGCVGLREVLGGSAVTELPGIFANRVISDFGCGELQPCSFHVCFMEIQVQPVTLLESQQSS